MSRGLGDVYKRQMLTPLSLYKKTAVLEVGSSCKGATNKNSFSYSLIMKISFVISFLIVISSYDSNSSLTVI